LNTIFTIALVAIGIVAALFVTRPYYESLIPDLFPEVTDTEIINEQVNLSSGRTESYEILTGDAKAMRLVVYPRNVDAKLVVSVYYLDGQNKTFAGKEQLDYIVDFGAPLDIEIIPEHDSTVVVDLQPFSQSNLNVKISLRHVR
jgi:hypothetical protein